MEKKFFDEEAFRKIDKEKLEIISRMFNEMQKKNAEERLQCLFSYGMEMRSKGIQFTKEESAMMMDVLKNNMSEQEKAKIDMIAGLMKGMG